MAKPELDSLNVLRRAGLRSTPQRLAIVREAFTQHHPTVAEIYEAVRRDFPTIGLATVYNTLRTMTERGIVSELPFVNATRFDVNLRPHANLVCTSCGAIEDFESCEDLLIDIRERTSAGTGFRPTGQRLDVYGLCSACAATTANR
jgi:Fur family peroxide stress response transcriptional regulator